MNLRTFTDHDEINQRIAKASEKHLPEDERRQAIAFVEEKLGRALTASEAERFAQVAKIAPRMVPGDDPAELTPVRASRRQSFTERSHVAIGIKGGQGRSGAEIERDAAVSALVIALAGAVLLGIGAAELIAKGSAAFGSAYLAN